MERNGVGNMFVVLWSNMYGVGSKWKAQKMKQPTAMPELKREDRFMSSVTISYQIRVVTNDYFHYRWIRLVVWSIKCEEMVKNVGSLLLKAKGNVLISLQS